MPEVEHQDAVESLLKELGAETHRYRIVMPDFRDDIYVLIRASMSDDESERVVRWAVERGGCVWTKLDEWEIEPQPSSRSDEFIERSRYGTLIEALQAVRRAKKQDEIRPRRPQRK